MLGLTKNEAKVFQKIIETANVEPLDIAQMTGLPRTRVYEVLSKLAAKNLLEKNPNGGGYRIIPPSESFGTLSEQLDFDFQQRKRSLHELGAHIQNVWVKNLAANVSPGVELYTYKDAESFFLQHLQNVQKRVFISVASSNAPINHRKSGATLAQAYNENLEVKYLVHSQSLAMNLSSAFAHFAPYQSMSIKMRYNNELHTSFVLVDDILYLYFFGSQSPLETVVLRTASTQLIESFDWMFDKLWDQGNDVPSSEQMDK
ncbi:MAG: TrmB family transcriptional regulator [Candidatus Kariarchaeaceae archaeon]